MVLLDEEMRRVLVFCDWKQAWWKQQIAYRSEEVSPELADGLSAYAHEQVAMEAGIATSFAGKWRAVRERARPLIDKVMHTETANGDIIVADAEVAFFVGEEDDDGGGSDFEE